GSDALHRSGADVDRGRWPRGKQKDAIRPAGGNIAAVLWFGKPRERQMNQQSDGRASFIYIGAITLVGLLIVFGSMVSFNASGGNDEPAKISTKAKP
ncbi:hypothetical protein, partial [Rhizobium leguminosarum]